MSIFDKVLIIKLIQKLLYLIQRPTNWSLFYSNFEWVISSLFSLFYILFDVLFNKEMRKIFDVLIYQLDSLFKLRVWGLMILSWLVIDRVLVIGS